MTMALKWGILSSGKICQDFTAVLKSLPPEEHQVVATAARNLDSAQTFAKRFSIPKAYGSYQELADDPDVDVVYIGTIHPYHAEVSKLMLNGGKSVLCEKPMCMNVKQATEVLNLAKEKKLFFMEGFWTRFFPVYSEVREAIKTGQIGEPLIVQVCFGDRLSNIDRMRQKELGGGALLDLGCYTVQLADMIFGKPQAVSAVSTMQSSGVDETTVITLRYPDNRIAVLTCSAVCELNNMAFIHGTKGIIQVSKPFWSATTLTINGEERSFSLPTVKEHLNFIHSEGFAYEAQHVREIIKKGDTESPIMSHESSLNILSIMDEARRQIGLVYEADK